MTAATISAETVADSPAYSTSAAIAAWVSAISATHTTAPTASPVVARVRKRVLAAKRAKRGMSVRAK